MRQAQSYLPCNIVAWARRQWWPPWPQSCPWQEAVWLQPQAQWRRAMLVSLAARSSTIQAHLGAVFQEARAEPRESERRRDTAYMSEPRYQSSDDERSTGSDDDTAPSCESNHSDGEVDSDNNNYAVNISVPKRHRLLARQKGSASSKSAGSWPARMSVQRTPSWPTMILNHDPLDIDLE